MAHPIREEIIDELEITYGLICPLCDERPVVVLHHIIPRGRDPTEPDWLWDKRNLIMLCNECHVKRGQTVEGRTECLRVQERRWPRRDYDVPPWREYLSLPYHLGLIAYNPQDEMYLCGFPDKSFAWMNWDNVLALSQNPRHSCSGVTYLPYVPEAPVSIVGPDSGVVTVELHMFEVKGFKFLLNYSKRVDMWVVGPLPEPLEAVKERGH